ncbi:MAG: hypothetical protein PVJ33_14480 [Lysobacterales bacterium]
MTRRDDSQPAGRNRATRGGRRRESAGSATGASDGARLPPDAALPKRNGGWREIEALREKAALKASLADVWDEDFDLDADILAELDHTAEFFTRQQEAEEDVFEDEDIDEFFDEEDV